MKLCSKNKTEQGSATNCYYVRIVIKKYTFPIALILYHYSDPQLLGSPGYSQDLEPFPATGRFCAVHPLVGEVSRFAARESSF